MGKLPANGVIRSHSRFPRKLRARRKCGARLPLRPDTSITLSLIEDDSTILLSIYAVSRNEQEHLLNKISMKETLILHGNTTSAVRIEVNFRLKRRQSKGFLMSYSGKHLA